MTEKTSVDEHSASPPCSTVSQPEVWLQGGKWSRTDGCGTYYPTQLFAVVPGNIAGHSWFDFSTGQNSGMVRPSCLTASEAFAQHTASRTGGDVVSYSLIRNP